MTAHPPKFKIVCVDDDEDTRSVIAEMIATTGFEPIAVADPATVAATLDEIGGDTALVLSDFRMPGMDGFALRRQLLGTRAKEIPFVILSAYVDRETALQGIDLGIAAFVSKPCSPDELAAVLIEKSRDRVEQLRERRMLEETFLSEAEDLMEELEQLLLTLEDHPGDGAVVASIFRLVHTIKGSSGVLGRDELTRFLHCYEDILTQLKSGARSATPPIISGLLAAYDVLGKTISALRQGGRGLPDLGAATTTLRAVAAGQAVDGGAAEAQEDPAARGDAAQMGERREVVAVPTQMLDEFMHLTGETTVIRNMVNKLVRVIERRLPADADVELLSALLDEMHKINASMQGKTSELRKTPMSKVLKKLPRTVRDVCTQLGKKVRLVTVGEGLRVDTAIAQAMSNSLIHMIRNSVDHGIEMPEARLGRGKTAEGTITLSCQEVRDHVVVELADDGGGIDPERIRTKLRDNGTLSPTAIDALSREQLLHQIFEPGFSTAKAITDVSGRGVGMDMVRTSIEQLKGKIDIFSEVGKGTRFKLTIPVPKSVVIINALIVASGEQCFAIPQDDIVRLLRLSPERRRVDVVDLGGAPTLRLSGQLLPLVSLREALKLSGPRLSDGADGELDILIVKWDGGSFGLVVDAIHGAEDVVVKSLHASVEQIGAFLGATFLDDGSVGLIVDIGGLARLTGQSQRLVSSAGVESGASVASTLQQGEELMLFELAAPGCFALPLGQIYRLEELSPDVLVVIGNRQVVLYRGETIPVVDLERTLELHEVRPDSEEVRDRLSVLIVSQGERLFALPIARVLDVARAEGELQALSQARPGLRGITTVDERVVTVVDLARVLAACGYSVANVPVEEKAAAPAPPPPSMAPAPPGPAEPPQDAGWGLF